MYLHNFCLDSDPTNSEYPQMDQDPIHCIFARGPKISIVDPDGVDPDSDLSAYQKTTFIQPNKFTYKLQTKFRYKNQFKCDTGTLL